MFLNDLVPFKVTGDASNALDKYIWNRSQYLKDQFETLFTVKLPTWRRLYKATPLEQVREYPFHNASNIVVPVVAIHVDTLLARVMASIFKISPFWALQLVDGSDDKEMEEAKQATEDALAYFAKEPEELDLYRVERDFYNDVIKFGHSTIKSLWEIHSYTTPVIAGDGYGFETIVSYEGPRPEKIPYEDFMATPTAKTIESADFKIHILHLTREKLEERAFQGIYDKAAVERILASPDRTYENQSTSEKLSDSDLQASAGYGYQQWDIYEIWFDYWWIDHKYKLVCTYHPKTKTRLRTIHNPFKQSIFIDANLFINEDLLFGFGFAEALGMFQESISETHNQRADAGTVANCNMLRVSPDSKLNSGYRIYPGAMLPAEPGEAEVLQFGNPQPMSMDEERITLELAERRTGVGQPVQALGSGTANKRGIYTAMGTLSLLQDRNDRTGLNISDMRYAHGKLGRLIAYLYGENAIKTKFDRFGETKAALIMKCLQAIKDGRVAIPITSPTASVNREVEKQNDLLLSGVMTRHYSMIGQMLAGVSNAMTPPDVKAYLEKAIESANYLMEQVFRHFGFDEPERMVPRATVTATQPGGAPPMVQPAGGPGIPGLLQGAPAGAATRPI